MKKIAVILCLVVFVFGCKDTTDDGPIGNPNGAQDAPDGVLLVFPHEDSLCNEGENPTPTESTVFFEWMPNDNASSYKLTIENLDSGTVSEYETSDFIFPVTIQRAVAFRWFVTYEFQGEAKESDTWNFYNAGPGVQTYAPFPAEIISPSMAETISSTTAVTLEWSGSDVDEDIVGFDVYFGLNSPPSINVTAIAEEQLTVSVESGNIYYWNVVTKDTEGNTSESGVFEFMISE